MLVPPNQNNTVLRFESYLLIYFSESLDIFFLRRDFHFTFFVSVAFQRLQFSSSQRGRKTSNGIIGRTSRMNCGIITCITNGNRKAHKMRPKNRICLLLLKDTWISTNNENRYLQRKCLTIVTSYDTLLILYFCLAFFAIDAPNVLSVTVGRFGWCNVAYLKGQMRPNEHMTQTCLAFQHQTVIWEMHPNAHSQHR